MDWSLTNPGLIYGDQQIDPTTGMPVPRVKFFPNAGARTQQYAKDASQAVQPSISTVEGQLGEPSVVPGREMLPGPVGGSVATSDYDPGQDQTKVGMDTPTPVLPQMFRPKFKDVSEGPYGLPTPVNPAETKIGKLLHILRAVGEGAAAGSQAGTFGGGFDIAQKEPYEDAARQMQAQSGVMEMQQRKMQIASLPWQMALARQKAMLDLQETQGKATTAGLVPTRTGQIYDARTGKWIPGGGPQVKEGNPDQQTYDYLQTQPNPDTGKLYTPAEASQKIAQMKQDVKPDPAAKAKDVFQSTMSKIAGEGMLSPDSYSSLPKMVAAIKGSKSISKPERQAALAYVATNTTPASQATNQLIRMEGLGQTREYPMLDTKNNNAPVMVTPAEINRAAKEEPGRYLAGGLGEKALNRTALIEDIRGNIQQTRDSLNAMPEFDRGTRLEIAYALRSRDPRGTMNAYLSGTAASRLTPEQQDYLINVTNLIENAMAMRSVLGAGQGSEDLRSAITAVIPNATTPTKEYGLKQLVKFENTLNRLERGVPQVPLRNNTGGGPSTQTSKPAGNYAPGFSPD